MFLCSRCRRLCSQCHSKVNYISKLLSLSESTQSSLRTPFFKSWSIGRNTTSSTRSVVWRQETFWQNLAYQQVMGKLWTLTLPCNLKLWNIQDESLGGSIYWEDLAVSPMLWWSCSESLCTLFPSTVTSWKQQKSYSLLESRIMTCLKTILDKTLVLKDTMAKFRKSSIYTNPLNCTQKITSVCICQIRWDACSQHSFGRKKLSYKNFTKWRVTEWKTNLTSSRL